MPFVQMNMETYIKSKEWTLKGITCSNPSLYFTCALSEEQKIAQIKKGMTIQEKKLYDNLINNPELIKFFPKECSKGKWHFGVDQNCMLGEITKNKKLYNDINDKLQKLDDPLKINECNGVKRFIGGTDYYNSTFIDCMDRKYKNLLQEHEISREDTIKKVSINYPDSEEICGFISNTKSKYNCFKEIPKKEERIKNWEKTFKYRLFCPF